MTPVIDDDPPEMGVVFRSNRLVRGTLIARPVWRKANRPMAKFAGIVGIVRGRDSQRVSEWVRLRGARRPVSSEWELFLSPRRRPLSVISYTDANHHQRFHIARDAW